MPDLWGKCTYRETWWIPDHRCPRRGPLGRCIAHWLSQCAWEWNWRDLHLSIDLSNLNRPTIMVDDEHEQGERPDWWTLDYGNDGSDPAISFGWQRNRPSETNP